jgi:hypothetical protein
MKHLLIFSFTANSFIGIFEVPGDNTKQLIQIDDCKVVVTREQLNNNTDKTLDRVLRLCKVQNEKAR